MLLEGKNTPSRLVFALLLKFFQLEARFPEQKAEITQPVIDYVAKQLRVGGESYANSDWQGRTLKRYRFEIRQFLGFRTFQVKDGKALTAWLQTQLLVYELKVEPLLSEQTTIARQQDLAIYKRQLQRQQQKGFSL